MPRQAARAPCRAHPHPPVCVCVCVLARVTRAAGGSSLRVGRGARPLSVEVECAARRPRYIRAGLLGLTGWRASLTAARRSRRARAPTHLMQATAVTCHTHRGERPRLEHAQRHIQANAQKRRRAGQPPARRRTNGGWSCRAVMLPICAPQIAAAVKNRKNPAFFWAPPPFCNKRPSL